MKHESLWAIGLMSGTSLDGIDAALIRTDGEGVESLGPWLTVPYDDAFRARLRAATQDQHHLAALSHELTLRHADAVVRLLALAEMTAGEVRVIGFHGQTVLHAPEAGITWQIGDGALLAEKTGIDVVCDFRSRDVAAGGQGAPLVPLYHAALCAALPKPVAVLNIGGSANVTYLGEGGEVIAFDTGPGNVLIDEWMLRKTRTPLDRDGAAAARGKVDELALSRYLTLPFFAKAPPKSLDRNAFSLNAVSVLSTADGAATLTAVTAASVAMASLHFPHAPAAWYVCGGGRHNRTLMKKLATRLGVTVEPVETLGWQGDALEAQAFGFLAVRSLYGMPLSLPTTTGCMRPVTGGAHHKA